MIDPPVTKARNVEGVVGLEGVRVHNAVRQDPLPDDRQQGLGPGVGDDGGEEPDCRAGLHPDQLRRRPCRGPRDKQLDEFTLLTGCQSAFSLMHRSHYNPL